ncbi:NUDIX domain-containing protein [Brevibacillus laterosporus]|uniref:NADH pyrophosphatase n=1 Tax=Brevibacillus laterosporus LMG 15441 TaxID=1042163 RepID=A0A075R3A6_BRELA|nr:NUDIX domain-containing protein [Brevibacillus laterosporus]HAS00567.1 NUDIX domain-containing protein [Brevibacillus sp.]AIG25653.1 NADH pyrophosphatase [Brevibacillus laterosporus LMG 15441]AUM64205.1 NUDIX domain-containing protein [Brevibacillus laterosporus]MDF9413772.1 NUDIX domain-containing protein [Brevibacillus laterosporus]RJL08050.1 NUDIX domain-containing protein [Brevibacillus laterosporus]
MATKMVKTVIAHEDQCLLIREDREELGSVWNIPSGIVQAGEKIMDAAVKRVAEKTGLQVELTSLSGIYQFVDETKDSVVCNVFTATVNEGTIQIDRTKIREAKWFRFTEIEQLDDDSLYQAHLLRRVFADIKNTGKN